MQVGYTITVKNGNLESSYCHISPKYIFKTGEFVTQKNIVAYVGPKNVYGVVNNPYKDSYGNPTNRCHNTVVISTLQDRKNITIQINYDSNLQEYQNYNWTYFFYMKKILDIQEKSELSINEQIALSRCKKKLSKNSLRIKSHIDMKTLVKIENGDIDIFLDTRRYDKIKLLLSILELSFDYPYETQTFGGKLRKTLFEQGMPPYQLAKLLNHHDSCIINKWLNNSSIPSINEIKKIKNILSKEL